MCMFVEMPACANPISSLLSHSDSCAAAGDASKSKVAPTKLLDVLPPVLNQLRCAKRDALQTRLHSLSAGAHTPYQQSRVASSDPRQVLRASLE